MSVNMGADGKICTQAQACIEVMLVYVHAEGSSSNKSLTAPVGQNHQGVTLRPHTKRLTWYETFTVPKGTSIIELLKLSGWLARPELSEFAKWCQSVMTSCAESGDQAPNPKAWYVGVYAQKQPLSYALCDQDRIEIYRPLGIDPMGKRRIKANVRQHKHKIAKTV